MLRVPARPHDLDAAAAREHPAHAIIVHGHVAASLRGEFGDVPVTARTNGTELFVSPLMSLYAVVEAYREEVVARPGRVPALSGSARA